MEQLTLFDVPQEWEIAPSTRRVGLLGVRWARAIMKAARRRAAR